MHEVRFVVIGGYGAVLQGSAFLTSDADIAPDPDPANLRRLCTALRELRARLRTPRDPDGVEFTCDEHLLAQMRVLTMVTPDGDFDLSFRPAAFPNGYADPVEHAHQVDVGGFAVDVASLDDIIESQEAANRPKDQAALPHLYALRDEIARQERERETD